MTLFIACLLIYHFDMDWWWYAIAALIWISHVSFERHLTSTLRNLFTHGRED